MGERSKKNYIGQAWLILVLAIVYGGGLAGVQIMLGDRITRNKKSETFDVIPQLVPGAVKPKTEEMLVVGKDGKDIQVYKAISAEGSHVGWVITAGGQGFADKIELLIGVDPHVETISGLYVLEQKETPGLGDYITSKEFQDRFKGKPADQPLVVVKTDPSSENQVRALTGATISSVSVTRIVNDAISNLKEALRQKE